MVVGDRSIHWDTNAVGPVNVSLSQKPSTASAVVKSCDGNQGHKRNTKEPINTDALQSGQSKEKPQESNFVFHWIIWVSEIIVIRSVMSHRFERFSNARFHQYLLSLS
jgi:hypothetical protein